MLVTSKIIFENVTLVSITVCLYYFYLSVEAYKLTWQMKPADIVIPNVNECWLIPIVSAVGFNIYKVAMKALLLNNIIPCCKDSCELQNKRGEKAVINISKALYYAIFTTWGYYLIKDENFFPA